jgi:hypothetical protein
MKKPRNLIGARILSILALAAALSIPWFGWWTLALAAALLVLGALLAPRPVHHAHKPRLRSALDAVKRRLVRHPWRPRGGL